MSPDEAIQRRAAEDGQFAIAYGLLRVADAIRDAAESVSLAIDGVSDALSGTEPRAADEPFAAARDRRQ